MNGLTDDVSEGQRFAEEIAIGPPVVVFEIVDEIVEQQFFLLLLLNFGADAHVQVHHECVDLARLPVLPQPSRHVEQDCLIMIEKRNTNLLN